MEALSLTKQINSKNMKPVTEYRDISQSIIYFDLEQLWLKMKFQPAIASSTAKRKCIQLDETDLHVFLLESYTIMGSQEYFDGKQVLLH